METQSATKERTDIGIKEPQQYLVVMHNDDFTTMEFVVQILEDIFHKDPIEAETLMMTVHKKGRATVGRYPFDIAVTKVNTAMARARDEGFPFRLTIESSGDMSSIN